jgi:uncharacterized membrane protein
MSTQEHATSTHGNERINAFSDGVFAIVITLLVLELKVPEHLPPGGLLELLPELMPAFLGHVVSFVLIGMLWVGHHNMFLTVKRHDRTLLWLNNFFLLAVATMPFFAGLLAHHTTDQASMVAYALNLIMAGLLLLATWLYATHRRRLVPAELPQRVVTHVARRILIAPVLSVVAIVTTFINPSISQFIFILIAVLYIFPNPFDVHHGRAMKDAGTN